MLFADSDGSAWALRYAVRRVGWRRTADIATQCRM